MITFLLNKNKHPIIIVDWSGLMRCGWIGFLFTLAIILYVAVWFIPSTAYHLDFFILTPRFTVGLLGGILLLGLWWYFFVF
jgi:hypothetical protein